MALATFVDANRYLDQDKVKFNNEDDATEDRIVAEREVLANVAGLFGDEVVATWDITDPQPIGTVLPPIVITEVVARLMAAQRYEKTYSLETERESEYASRLRRRVDEWFAGIRSGEITMPELDISVGTEFDESWFWPNSTDVIEGTLQPNRRFSMDMQL